MLRFINCKLPNHLLNFWALIMTFPSLFLKFNSLPIISIPFALLICSIYAESSFWGQTILVEMP